MGNDVLFYAEQQFAVGWKRPHVSGGAGFRFIMNDNFIIALDYGMPISKFYSDDNPLKGQDGNGGMYIGLGYLF